MNYRDKLMSSPIWKELMDRPTPLVRNKLVNGSSAGYVSVEDIREGDELISVIDLTNLVDYTEEFKNNDNADNLNAQDGFVNNNGGTSTSDKKLLVSWLSWIG
jgi:hypothetical protein